MVDKGGFRTSRVTRAGSVEFKVERYRFILQQLHSINENVYRFLGIYQALSVAMVTAGLGLMVGYKKWGIDPDAAKVGVIGLMLLISLTATTVVLLVLAGLASWVDYRREECRLVDPVVHSNFRSPPDIRNWYRWYETYVIIFILFTVTFLWIGTYAFVLPLIG